MIAGLAILLRLVGTPWLVLAAYTVVARYVTPGIHDSLSARFDRLGVWYLLSLIVAAAIPAMVLVLGHRFYRRPRWRGPAALLATVILAWSVIQLANAEAIVVFDPSEGV